MSRPEVDRAARHRPARRRPPGGNDLPRPTRGAWLAAALGALCFLNSLWSDFVYDDLGIVRDNPRIRSLTNFSGIWLSDWWKPADEQDVTWRYRDRLYRPLTMYTFALNYAAGGLAPAGYHAVNVLLHAVVCLLVWRLAQRLFDDVAIANCATLVFAVHPIHCEAVANVVGRAEVLAALFLLLGLLVLLPATRAAGWQRAVAAAVLFLAALFSKETAVCYLPVALLALHAAAPRPQRRPARWWLMHTAILLAPLVIYLPLRYVALDHRLLRDLAPHVLANPLAGADLPHHWLHAFTILGHYTRLLVAPMKLSANYGIAVIDAEGGPELLTWVGVAAALAALLGLAGYARAAGPWRWLAVLTAWSIASYGLISNTVLLIGVSLAERLAYWLSVPLLLALAVGVVHLWRTAGQRGKLTPAMARLLRICGVLLLGALGLRSVVRNMDWSSNRALFEQDVRTYPQSAEINKCLANELLWEVKAIRESGKRQDTAPLLERADHHLGIALEIHPPYPRALQLRGQALGMLGQRERAVSYLEEASRLGPLDSASRGMLAELRDRTGEQAARLSALAEAASTRPTDVPLRIEYAHLLLQRGRDQAALAELEELTRLAPDNAEALRLLGDAYAARAEAGRAVEAYQRALAISPDEWLIHVNLVGLLAGADPAGSLRHAQRAYRLKPEERATQRQLAEALALNRRFDEALALYRKLAESLSADDPLRPVIDERIRRLEQGWP